MNEISRTPCHRIKQTLESCILENIFIIEDGVKRVIMIKKCEATFDELIAELISDAVIKLSD